MHANWDALAACTARINPSGLYSIGHETLCLPGSMMRTADPLAIVNSPMATLARESFGSPETHKKKASLHGPEQLPYCAKCEEKPSPPYSLSNVRHDIHSMDFKRVISEELAGKLTAW
jgi:hypothetical protein